MKKSNIRFKINKKPQWTDQVKVEETYSISTPEPQTELERQLVKRLGWDNYFFQFPDVTKYTVKKIKRLNLDTEEIEYTPMNLKITEGRDNKHTAWQYIPKYVSKQSMKTRFAEYCSHLNLPLDFKEKFPYLYAILQDYYVVNMVNNRNLFKMRRKLKGLVKLNMDYITIIFYQHYLLKQMPHFQEICNNDRFMQNFIDDVSHILKLVFTKGMNEEYYNEILKRTIDTIKKLKSKKK